jgi:hypothetical protein
VLETERHAPCKRMRATRFEFELGTRTFECGGREEVVMKFAYAVGSVLTIGFATLVASRASADEGSPTVDTSIARTPHRQDYLFPAPGAFSASLSTGVPFVALGEVAYGVSDGFALGLLGGATPIVMGAGVRPRGVVFHDGPTRITLTVPVLYYPPTSTDDAWMLARPTALVEHSFDSGVRLNAGVGAVAAACTDSLFSLGREHSSKFMGGAWNTAEIGGAVALSSKTSLFGEATAVLHGVAPAGRDWIGGPPVIVAVGVATSL